MSNCKACGGVLGRDCFNEQDCLSVSRYDSQYVEQLRRELDWERNVVIPDIEQKLSSALVTVFDLCTILKRKYLSPSDRDFVNASIQFYSENINHRIKQPETETDDLPF